MAITPKMITVDCAGPRALGQWWASALGTEIVRDMDGWFVIVAAPPLLLGFQKVPEAKAGKNRVHVDFGGDREAEVARLVELGATLRDERTAPGSTFTWNVLTDPEGNEFCVSDG